MQATATNYYTAIPYFVKLLVNSSSENENNRLDENHCYPDENLTHLTADCGFLITSAVLLPNGDFQISVQANDQVSVQSWEVFDGFPGPNNPAIASGNQPNVDWDLPNAIGPNFVIRHTVTENGKTTVCNISIRILPQKEFCEEGIVTATVEKCNLATSININTSNMTLPYVIDFGDESLAEQSSASQITHTYGQPGNYEVCITYRVPGNEGRVTCCYPISVTLPPHCICPTNVVSLSTVEPCSWVSTLNFDLEAGDFPITVDYGDGTAPEVVTGPTATHDFPDNDTYQVCYTFEVEPGDTLTCCESVSLPLCCLDASFTVTEDEEYMGSCFNPRWIITPTACLNPAFEVTHIWEFPDGEVFIGPFPDPQIFTDFLHNEELNPTGEICIKHTIVCCDESVTEEVCVEFTYAAYVGEYGEETNLDDIILNTGQTVLEFIQQHASSTQYPLLIDGQLNINVDNAVFTGGTWNMGKDSEILVVGGNITRRQFKLTGTTIQSAVRLGYIFCCRWEGIRSDRLTLMDFNAATIMDAKYAIHYDRLTANSPFPMIRSVNTLYENNYYGIKSVGQFVAFRNFEGNTLDGTSLPTHICGCLAVNAIDFREVGTVPITPITINLTGPSNNEILNYERGFNLVNTQLTVRGFNIHHLREYDEPNPFVVPVNLDGQTAIGIDYLWGITGNNGLNLDRMSFTDFEELNALSYAVRDRIFGGRHTLSAFAATLGSINTAGIAGGYDILVQSPGLMVNGSTIRQNTISTDGSSTSSSGAGFGITGNFNSVGNIIRINDNTINVSTGSGNPMNGGIVMNGNGLSQPFSIENNIINPAIFDGVGIGVTGAEQYCIRLNNLTSNAPVTGIELNGGGVANIDCNDVFNKPLGINVLQSTANIYSANHFNRNVNDMHFAGDNMGGGGGSLIQWNTFEDSENPSLIYDADAVTGEQDHDQYNFWTDQNGPGTFEVDHAAADGSIPVLNSRFHRPSNVFQGSVHFPRRDPLGMMFNSNSTNIETLPSTLCSSTSGCFAMLQGPNPNPEEDYAAIVQDATFLSGLTAAQQASLRQGLYGLLLENPTWLSGSGALSGFKAGQDASFVGQSETLRHAWLQLMDDISAQQATLAPTYAALDALSNQLQQWFDAIAADPSLEASLQGPINAANQQGEALGIQLQQADDQFAPIVQATIAQLLAQNAALDGTAQHAWNEKRYNQIALNWLAGTEPDATAIADLRTIAQTCLKDGGRAVLSARGLCSTWLKEYYGESSCNSLHPRSSDEEISVESPADLRIVPNPADDMVRISLKGNSLGGQQVQVFGTDGRLVFTGKLPAEGELSIPVKGWNDGLYIAKITGDSTTLTRSFVVQHP